MYFGLLLLTCNLQVMLSRKLSQQLITVCIIYSFIFFFLSLCCFLLVFFFKFPEIQIQPSDFYSAFTW